MFSGLHRRHLAVVARVALRSGEGQDGNVLPVAPLLFICSRQLHVYSLASGDVGSRVGEVAHSLLWLDPRPAARSPARARLQAEAQAQAVGLLGSVPYQRFPFRAQAFHMLLRAGPVCRITHLPVEELHTLDARSRYGLQVARYALAPDAAVEEVEPRLRIENAVGMPESRPVGIRERASQPRRIGHGGMTHLRQGALPHGQRYS